MATDFCIEAAFYRLPSCRQNRANASPFRYFIWNFARDNGFIIVTNNEDFLNFSNVKGFPPKIILLRTDNQSNNFLVSVLIKHKEDIQSFAASEEYGLLAIY